MNQLDNFTDEQDQYKEIFEKKEIYMEKYKLDLSRICDQDLHKLFNEHLPTQMQHILDINYKKELYFLKRNTLSSFEEYLNKKSEKHFKQGYLNIPDDIYKFTNFGKEDENNYESEIQIVKYFDCVLEMSKNPIEVAKSLYLNVANMVFETERQKARFYVWLEILNEEEILKIVDIHLTSEYFAKFFAKNWLF